MPKVPTQTRRPRIEPRTVVRRAACTGRLRLCTFTVLLLFAGVGAAKDNASGQEPTTETSAVGETAAEPRPPQSTSEETRPGEEDWGLLGKTIDRLHSGISAGVEHSAKRVDSFFSDDRFYADTTKSYARISGETTWESSEGTTGKARVRARFDLPGTRERLRLFLEGGDADETTGGGSGSIPEALDDNDYDVGLEAQLEDTGKWDIRPGLGVKAGTTPDPFLRIRATRYERLDGWLMRFSTGATEYLDDGTDLRARLDFDRKINPTWLVRSTSGVRYLDRKDRTEALQQFSLFQKLSGRTALAYETGVLAHDDPDWDVDHYFVQFRARVRAYKKWLFVELRPQLHFREEDDYDPTFLVSLRIDTVFGARYR